MHEADTDLALLRRTGEGDKQAFRQFMQRHAPLVHHHCLLLRTSEAEAEVALQECFVVAWKTASTYSGPESAGTWLLAIAHEALRHLPRTVEALHGAETLEELEGRAGWGSPTDPGPLVASPGYLDQALAGLPDEERQAVVLRDLRGQTEEEAAVATGLSPASSEKRLHRGRLGLMAALRTGVSDDA